MTTSVPPIETTRANTARVRLWRRLIRNPLGLISLIVLFLIVVLGIIAPLISAHDPNTASLNAVNAPVGTPGYLLGGDQSGRDIAARLLASINTSVISALIGTSVALVVGVFFGLVGGYFGRRVGASTEWLFNLIMTFPGLILLIVLLPVTKGAYPITMAIFGVLLAPGIYRVVRNLVVSVKNEAYVDAARVSGLTNTRIVSRHILSVIRGPIIISSAFLAGAAIATQAGLAFLGVGDIAVPSFGSMISDGFTNLYTEPLQFLWPSIVLGLLTAMLVLLGNALRDTLEGVTTTPARIQRGDRASVGVAAVGRDAAEYPALEIDGIRIAYATTNGEVVDVVKDVSFSIARGEIVGLVGESGSGKTQTAFSALGVLPPEAVVRAGTIRIGGQTVLADGGINVRREYGSAIAYIPQEPMSNLDPAFTIGSQLVEGIRASSDLSRSHARTRALELLERVGIVDAQRVMKSYPHQISGGMAQRVLIAGAVASRPRLLIADEPTTALDVTVQAEILDIIRDLQEEMGMAVLLVTHNFGVVADLCDRVVVMKQGEVIEIAPSRELFAHPQDPYTQMLLSAILDDTEPRTDLVTERAARSAVTA